MKVNALASPKFDKFVVSCPLRSQDIPADAHTNLKLHDDVQSGFAVVLLAKEVGSLGPNQPPGSQRLGAAWAKDIRINIHMSYGQTPEIE